MYELKGYRTYRIDDEGERTLLASFVARISRETRIVDGVTTETTLTLEGEIADPTKAGDDTAPPIKLPPVEVAANAFAGMAWVLAAWGVRAIIHPGASIKEDLRVAIQINSKPEIKTIYRSIGWTDLDGERAYLHANGAITAKGNDEDVTVRLPQELQNYDLTTDRDPAEAFAASMELANLSTPEVGWTLLAATFAPLFGPVDFAIHVTGRTGTFKSELISLFQSHYGADMDARHLPGSWSSTANALEAQAYYAANAIFVVDDFVPIGTSWQIRSYQTTADKLIRAQGNQSGRARLTDTSNLQSAYYPRGLVVSTGEDTPEGHSVRARMMILELSPGDVEPADLTRAQSQRPIYTAVIAELIKDLCKTPINIKARTEKVRNQNLDTGHTRTPPMLGRLIATIEAVLDWGADKQYISKIDAGRKKKQAEAAIKGAAEKQQNYLENSDPVEIFINAFRQSMNAGLAHTRSLNGGVPKNPTILGWTKEQGQGEMATYKSHGPCIAWINWDENELYLEVNAGYTLVKKITGSELSLTKQTLFKRMKDAGLLQRIDEGRQRNTVRVTAEGHPRQVIVLAISTTLETQEVPNDETQEDGNGPGGNADGDAGDSGINDSDPYAIPD